MLSFGARARKLTGHYRVPALRLLRGASMLYYVEGKMLSQNQHQHSLVTAFASETGNNSENMQ